MEQKEFQDILKRYLQDNATPAEKRLIDKWYGAMEPNGHHHGIEDEPELETRIWSKVSRQLQRRHNSGKLMPWYLTGVAASMAIVVIAYAFIVNQNTTVQKDVVTKEAQISLSWRYVANSNKEPELFVLPDKSRVTIQPGSKLRFSSGYNEVTREVYLEGEAFFEVSKNAERPFFVYANEVTTKVLGTSFTVKAIEKQVTIVVRTGRVSVYANHQDQEGEKVARPEEIILTPNQQVVIDKEEKKISKTLVDKPQVIIPEEEVIRMRFEEAPVPEIFKALEKVYGVDIEFDESVLSSCELTTIISDNDIFKRLSIICNAIGATYVLEDGIIVINSEGCK